MTKNEILATVRRATEQAWLEMARNLEMRCPRESVAKMFDWSENDAEYCKLRHAWATLYAVLEDVGYVSDEECDRINGMASVLIARTYSECRAAEGKQ